MGRPFNRWRLLMLATLGLAVLWRLPDLGERGLTFDEAFSWQLTRFPWGEMIARAADDVHPPLYYAGLKLWTGVLGDSAFAMRLLSVAWLVAALAGAGLLCREADPAARSGDAGLTAASFLAVCPFLMRHSQEARMYTQAVALTLLSTWLLLRALRGGPAARWWFGYAAAASALVYTHYFGVFAVAAQWTFLAAARRPRAGAVDGRESPRAWAWAAPLLVAASALPWAPTALAQQRQVSDDYWMPPPRGDRSPLGVGVWGGVALASLVPNPGGQGLVLSDDPAVLHGLGIALFALTAPVLIMLTVRGGRLGRCLAAGIIIPPVLAAAASYRVGRLLVEGRYLAPPLALLLVGTAVVIARLNDPRLRRTLAALVVANLAVLTADYRRSLYPRGRADLRSVADRVAHGLRPTDLVLCTDPYDVFPLRFHSRGRFAVYLARLSGLTVTHFSGGPLFRRSDFLEWDGDAVLGASRLWVIGPIPDLDARGRTEFWRRRTVQIINEPVPWHGPVALELWDDLFNTTH